MSEKSSTDYAELAGLRIFISHYKPLYKRLYDDRDEEMPAIPQSIISEIETRIQYLESK